MTPWLSLLNRLLRSWWMSDRIRISPRAGELLRLRIGDLVEIAGDDWEIVSRTVRDTLAGAELHLECQHAEVTGRLRCAVTEQGTLEKLEWSASGRQRRLLAEEIQVWPRAVREPVGPGT